MIRSLFFGVSGVKSHQTRMDVIGNNIANTNTAGFKAGRAVFTDVLSQTQASASKPADGRGGINAMQVGLGTGVGSVDRIFTDAPLITTGKNANLALEGNAFFVIGQGNGMEMYYTRDGAFEFDSDGNYVLPGSGLYVKGWTSVDGSLDTSGIPGNITVPIGRSIPPKGTEIVTYSNNLDAGTPTINQMVLTDNLGGRIAVSSTSPVTIGSTVTANVSNVAVTFSNGVSLPSTSSGYANGTTYGFSGMTATLSNGTTVNLSSANGSARYTVGGVIQLPITSMTVVTNVGTITPGSGTTTQYGIGAIAPSVLNSVQIISGPVPNGANFDYTLSDGSVLTAASNAYLVGATLDDPTGSGTATLVTTSSITGTLSDGATFVGGVGGYTLGVNIPFPPTQITGNITTAGGALIETFNMTSGSVTPGATATPSNIELTTNLGTVTVGPLDTTAYLPGSTYTATITKAHLSLTDGTAASSTSAGISYTIGHSVPMPTTVTIYDSLGDTHDITIYLEKSGPSNQWMASLYTTQIQEANGTIVNLSMQSVPIQFTQAGVIASGQVQGLLNLTYPNGNAQSQAVTIDFSKLVQRAEECTVYGDGDGYTSGTCSKVQIDPSGTITGTYTNGMRRTEAKIAVAQFNNPSGLTDKGNGIYQATNNSGSANIKSVSAFGAKVSSGAVEMSNVDLSAEFYDMITSQRGFQTSSKIMTASDEFVETLINLKR